MDSQCAPSCSALVLQLSGVLGNSTFGSGNSTFQDTENSTFEDTGNSTFADMENSTFADTGKF